MRWRWGDAYGDCEGMDMTCSTCKWLDVSPEHITKDGRTKKTIDHRVFKCLVPYEPVPMPSCFVSQRNDRRLMAPIYGASCPFNERRK